MQIRIKCGSSLKQDLVRIEEFYKNTFVSSTHVAISLRNALTGTEFQENKLWIDI